MPVAGQGSSVQTQMQPLQEARCRRAHTQLLQLQVEPCLGTAAGIGRLVVLPLQHGAVSPGQDLSQQVAVVLLCTGWWLLVKCCGGHGLQQVLLEVAAAHS